MRKFLREYLVEILFVVAVFIGAIIFFGEVKIISIFVAGFQGFVAGVKSSISGLTGTLKATAPSMLAAYFLAVAGLVFIVWRARWRYLRSNRYRSQTCPKCGSKLNRLHRTRGDHFLSKVLFIPFYRYRCSSSECGWNGLKKPGRRKKRKSLDEEIPQL